MTSGQYTGTEGLGELTAHYGTAYDFTRPHRAYYRAERKDTGEVLLAKTSTEMFYKVRDNMTARPMDAEVGR